MGLKDRVANDMLYQAEAQISGPSKYGLFGSGLRVGNEEPLKLY